MITNAVSLIHRLILSLYLRKRKQNNNWIHTGSRWHRRHGSPNLDRYSAESGSQVQRHSQRWFHRYRNPRARSKETFWLRGAPPRLSPAASSLWFWAPDSLHGLRLLDGTCAAQMVRFPVEDVSFYQDKSHYTRAEESRVWPVDLFSDWFGHLLYFHDDCRRRWEESDYEEIPGSLHSRPEGKLYGLAGCANSEFQSHAIAVSDCKFWFLLLRVFANIKFSFPALCINNWYCVDGIPLLDKLFRRIMRYPTCLQHLSGTEHSGQRQALWDMAHGLKIWVTFTELAHRRRYWVV